MSCINPSDENFKRILEVVKNPLLAELEYDKLYSNKSSSEKFKTKISELNTLKSIDRNVIINNAYNKGMLKSSIIGDKLYLVINNNLILDSETNLFINDDISLKLKKNILSNTFEFKKNCE